MWRQATVFTALSVVLLYCFPVCVDCWSAESVRKESFVRDASLGGRRHFLTAVATTSSILLPSWQANAEEEAEAAKDEDLTSKLYDLSTGSLKEGVESEARFRRVEFVWDASSSTVERYLVNIDGINTDKSISDAASSVKVSYDLPMKWKGPPDASTKDLYLDLTVQQVPGGETIKALTSITVYQSPGVVKQEQLEKAASVGVAKALNVVPALSSLESADLVGGRVRTISGTKQKMFDFDLAVAPKTCGDSNDNLGLGFCPFDSVYLLSGTVVNERLYVFALQCDKEQWKRSNSDLRKVRSTFSVSSLD